MRASLAVSSVITTAVLASLPGCGPRPDRAPVVEPQPMAPTLLESPQADIASICSDTQARGWRILGSEGEEEGSTRGACLGKEVRGYHLVSQYLPAQATQPTLEYHLWLGRDGEPKTAQLRSPTMVRRFFWTPDGLRTSIFGDVEPIVDVDEDVWVIPRSAPFIEEVALRLGRGVHAQGIEHVYVRAETGERTSTQLTPSADGASDRLEGSGRVYAVRGDSLGHLHLDRVDIDHGGSLHAAGDVELAPQLPEIPRPTYQKPDDLDLLAVSIGADKGASDEATLAGELVRRADASGPQPGIIFFSGSGPQERHGFVPGTSIDVGSHELHDALARAGFSVLRYDDRGVGESELGLDPTYGYATILDDARRATHFLVNHPDVDPKRIILIGHSEGALTASLLGQERFGKGRRRPAGVVMMAGAGRNLRDVIYSQIRGTAADPAEVEKLVAQAKKIHKAILADGELPANVEPARTYFKEIFQYDPVEVVDDLRVPVLVAQGAKDFQVDPEMDFEPLRDTVLPKSNKGPTKGSDARLFDGLDHLFKLEPGASSVGHYGDMRRHVDPSFIQTVTEWAQGQVGISPHTD